MTTSDIVVKETLPVRMAATQGIAAGFGHRNVGPVFAERLPVVWNRLMENGIQPGTCVAFYDWPDEHGRVVVHLGFDIGGQSLPEDDDVRVVELPVVDVASGVHRGPLDDISETYEAVVRWIDEHGYRIADCSRELTLEWDPQDPAQNIVELQLPIGR